MKVRLESSHWKNKKKKNKLKWWKKGNREMLEIDGLQWADRGEESCPGGERDKCWKSCLLRWLKGFWGWQNIWCTRPARCFCRLQLVSCFNASFLCVLIQIMCKHKNMHALWQTLTHRRTQQLFSLNLTCVFIKVSSCSIVLRSNGDWLWHNYTNPCMNLVLMEAEHLTQTKCMRADQCRGTFSPLSLRLNSSQLTPKQDIYICNASPLR